VNDIVRLVLGAAAPTDRAVALPAGVHAEAIRALIDPGHTAFMTCGNPGMIGDLREPVARLGVTTYLTEEFWKA